VELLVRGHRISTRGIVGPAGPAPKFIGIEGGDE
jgi:hypothetical protein